MSTITLEPSAETAPGQGSAQPTIWGLNPSQLHDHFWAARGVQVVRQGEPSEIVEGAELYLLTDPRTLVMFRLRDLVNLFSWMKPDLLFVRLESKREHGYQEHIRTDQQEGFVRFERVYGAADTHLTRVAFTNDLDLAQAWQNAPTPNAGWRSLRSQIDRNRRESARVRGYIFDRTRDEDVAQFVRDLIAFWKHPSATISRARKVGAGAWADTEAQIDRTARIIGAVWVGAGRKLESGTPVVGPAALWDDPSRRPVIENIKWQEIEPTQSYIRPAQPRRLSSIARAGKRMFDIVFSFCFLVLTLPLYPVIAAAIMLEDGWPVFFWQKRETVGGSEFACWKFRSMRRDADAIKARLQKVNQADGPQFFMDDDPRLTRVGKFLRKTNLDEFPQFWNVLVGDMSIIGPRPSPRSENQYCPPWREARLSVRPGITGLWQIKRTRRRGLDFQEWIKFDIQYVENQSWWMDMYILWQTFIVLLRGVTRR